MTGEHAPIVAAFDFDATLTHHDSVLPFLRRVAGTRRLVTRLLARGHRVLVALFQRDRDRLRGLATDAVFRGATPEVIEAHAAEHARSIVAGGLRHDTIARLRWHLDAGHRVVIVSASYEHYVRVVAEQLGVHGVVATRLETGADGRFTGRLEGANCRAHEKVRRLDIWLAERGLTRSEITLWAYGDSAGDRDLLAAADHPVWVKRPLASVAPTV